MTALHPEISRQLYSTIAQSLDNPIVNIQRYRKISEGFYSAIFTTAELSRSYSFKDYDNVVSETTDNKMGIIEGSLYSIDDSHVPMYRCILFSKVESRPYDDENVKGMVATVANQFTDENDEIWKVIGSGKNKRLVQISEDDFDQILEARRQRNPVVASFNAIIPYENGDYVRFFNNTMAAMDFGHVWSRPEADFVFSRSQEQLVKINPDQVVEAAEPDNDHNPNKWLVEQTLAASFSVDKLLEYYKTLFSGTKFYDALERAIKRNAVR